MHIEIPYPICFAMCGALAGLVGGGCNQCFPVWVGATTGASIGCAISICVMATSVFTVESNQIPTVMC